MNGTVWPLATLAMLAVIVAGCSNAPAGIGGSNGIAATHEKGRSRAHKGRTAPSGRDRDSSLKAP